MSARFNQRQTGIAGTPANTDIMGVGVPAPGVGVGPARRPGVPSGPNYVQWNAGPAGTAVMPAIGFGADGLPNGARTVREFMSNTFVQQQYMTNKWRNKSELAMIEGQLCFIHRSTPSVAKGKAIKKLIAGTASSRRSPQLDFRSYTIINLPHFNALLHRAWVGLRAAADAYDPRGANSKRVMEAHRLMELMGQYSEDEIANYLRFKNNGKYAERFDPNDSVGDKGLEELVDLALRGNFRYAVCPQLILSEYSFSGAIQNVSRGTSMEGINNPNRRDDVLVTNVVVAKKAEVHNVFEPHREVDSGSKLFFILSRRRMADNRVGSFVMRPVACKHNDQPTLAHRYYRDLTGCLCVGLVRAIGYVQLPGDRFPNPTRQQVASGVRPPANFELPKQATAILPKIQIQIDMNV